MILTCLLLMWNASQDTWNAANEAYKNGQYEEAAIAYLSLLNQGIDNGPLHFNLGNAYLRSGKLGKAILHYYRAEKHLPFDDDLAHNLALANQMRQDPQIDEENDPFLKKIDHFMSAVDSRVPYYLAMICWLLAGFASIGLVLGWDRQRLCGYTLVIAGIIAVLSTGLAFVQYRHLTRSDYAVVVANEIQVMSGPSRRETVSFTIHEGIRCQIMSASDDWVRIRLANGYNGWVPHAKIERI